MRFNKLKKVGIVIGLFILIWALLNLVPIGKFKVYTPGLRPGNYEWRYCTLNAISCFSEMGYSEGYPKFLDTQTSIILVAFVLPIILTALISIIITKKLDKMRIEK